MKKSIRGVIFYDNNVLLIKRIKKGHEYYVVPGGHIEMDEKEWVTCVRELKEETGLDVQPIKKVFISKSKRHQNIFYFCSIKKKENIDLDPNNLPIVKLVGEEKYKSSKDNYYKPLWVDVSKIKNMRIYPIDIKPIIIKLISYINNHE